MSENIRKRGALPFFSGLFLLCMCGLMLQIVETRILSVIVYYNLAFVEISLAMLGMTIGALVLHILQKHFQPEEFLENLTWIASAFACSVVVSMLFLISDVVPSGVAATTIMSVLLWLKTLVILLPPYVFVGMGISLAITRSPWPVGFVYGVDLIGAACGCLMVLLLLDHMDGISVLIMIAAFAAFAGACFAAARPPMAGARQPSLQIARVPLFQHPLRLAVVLGAIGLGNAAIQPAGLVLTVAKNEIEQSRPVAQRWNSFSRVRVTNDFTGRPMMWGPSPKMPPFSADELYLNIDGDAATAMYAFDGNLSKLDFLRYDITNLAYSIRHRGRAAVIGVGGGRDLLSAYTFGFRDVTGVELNPIFVDFLKKDFHGYNRLTDLPGLRLISDEARSWFSRTNEHFDLVEMSLVDTWAATGAGAYSLSENGLYTVQGWRHFIEALTPNGVLTVSRWFNPANSAEMGRLTSLATATLLQEGVAHPERHLFLATTPRLATLVLSRAPFTSAEIATLRARTAALGFDVLLSPDRSPDVPLLREILAARTPSQFDSLTAKYHINVSIPTDERPFFFNILVPTDPKSWSLAFASKNGVMSGTVLGDINLFTLMGLSALLVIYSCIVPALPAFRQTSRRLATAGTLYFLLIGLGFMFVEIGLIQRFSMFLGHPVYGLAIGLFGIILSTGIGSLLSERLRLESVTKISVWSIMLFSYLAALIFWLPSIVHNYESGLLPVRALVSLCAIVPLGVLMGFGFPTGMRLINAIDPRPTPWFWAVNGAAGVLAASMAVVTSIAFSINVSLWFGATCYLLLGPVSVGLTHVSRRFAQLKKQETVVAAV